MYILDPRWETVLIKSLFAWTWVTASTLYLQFSMASETILKRHIRNFSWRYFLTFSIPSPGKYLICEVTSNAINFMPKLTSIIDWLYYSLVKCWPFNTRITMCSSIFLVMGTALERWENLSCNVLTDMLLQVPGCLQTSSL